MSMEPLNETTLARAVEDLCRREPRFRAIRARHGLPPLWQRPAGFLTLLHIILEQQVSLASARAVMDKMLARHPAPDAALFLELDDGALKSFGFSRQKMRYGRLLAAEIAGGRLDPGELSHLPDEEARQRLTRLTGIGPWTADIYLLMVLLRPDVWPHGDRALAVAAGEVFKRDGAPPYDELRRMAEDWRPYRAVAARLLWHHYLNTPRKG